MKKNLLALFGACILFSFHGAAGDIYVNLNSLAMPRTGTITNPFVTIQAGLNAAIAGDRILVRAGSYKERLLWPTSGTATAPITLTAYKNVVYDVVYLDGGSGGTNSSQNPMIVILNKSYVRISNITIRNNYRNDACGIFINGKGQEIKIDSCRLTRIGWPDDFASWETKPKNSNKNAHAIDVIGDSLTAYSNIYVGNCTIDTCSTGWSEGLTMNGNVDGFTIEKNDIHDITNIGIDIAGFWIIVPAGASSQARNGRISNNKVYRCVSKVATSAGIYVDGGKSVIIENNRVYENGSGIEAGCENANDTVTGINIRNNFAYNNKTTGIIIGAFATNSVVKSSFVTGNTLYKNYSNGGWGGEIGISRTNSVSIKNNIVYSRSNVVVTTDLPSTSLILDYNLYFTPGTVSNITFDWYGINNHTYTGFATYRTATGQDSHSSFINPNIVNGNLPSPDLHIATGSSAIDAGDPAYVVATGETDIDGQARINTISPVTIDIGADEKYAGARMANPSFAELTKHGIKTTTAGQQPTTESTGEILVYPNPVSDRLLISLPAKVSNASVDIFAEQGQLLYSKKVSAAQTTVNISAFHLPPQTMLVRITADCKIITNRIIVK